MIFEFVSENVCEMSGVHSQNKMSLLTQISYNIFCLTSLKRGKFTMTFTKHARNNVLFFPLYDYVKLLISLRHVSFILQTK